MTASFAAISRGRPPRPDISERCRRFRTGLRKRADAKGLPKLLPDREQIKIPDLSGRIADAPAEQHIERIAAFAA